MEMTSPFARPFARRPVAPTSVAAAGAALLALGFYMAIGARQPIVAALAGAAGLALLRWARAERPYSAALIAVDAAAFAIFAFQRNDSIGFWQLPGPWADVWRFNPAGATIALIVYTGGSIMALIAGFRGLRLIEALSLIAVPFLFNLLMAIGADWHMAELGAIATAHAGLPFPVQVAIGRALTLWFVGEAMLTLINLVSVNRLPRSARTHGLFALSGASRRRDAAHRQRGADGRSAVPGDFFLELLRRARPRRPVGDRLSLHRHYPRLARRPPAALRDGLGALANRLRQGRDLRRAVHGLHPRRRSRPARARRGDDPRSRRASHRSRRRRARLSARPDDHRQRRRDGAVLRPAQGRLSRSARACARHRRRPRPCAGLSRRPRRLRRRRAVSGDGRGRGALLRRRRSRLSTPGASSRASGGSCKAGAFMRWGSCSARSSPARSDGISTRRSFRS